jgi:hypothetical protein
MPDLADNPGGGNLVRFSGSFIETGSGPGGLSRAGGIDLAIGGGWRRRRDLRRRPEAR